MHAWHWRNWQGMPYLTCSLLEPWSHGFFTHPFWPRSPQELTQVLQPEASVYRLKQVHGNTVLTPQEVETKLTTGGDDVDGEGESALASADGLISEKALQAVWVASADCTPVLIGDLKTGQVAAIHAGWRGTAKKIVPQAIARLQAQGSKLEDLRIAMGPAIAGEVYQVSVEVAAEVGGSIISHEDANAIVDALHELPNSPLIADDEAGKVKLDVRRVNTLQIESLGISGEQIAIAPYCTYQTPEHFFSYRREQQKKVQWSGIVSFE
ncbi:MULTISPECIES: peptidoglycan editing factor PgeF [Calothrix]|uniref:Purine nucleoside phosphorylase n=2 Tax=Calothrix TaxID=1186 RepID=A0ABR8ABY1_9CYAN|nr:MULTISPECIES: peptidoglycan editing factor PgeF [Calothrix]MBD2197414.1 peptidoglycan editing factor PgeF [Calothrix parietina FACHB-288]MBD2225981.1 peptidoglycan editing factor PgeF [Calothrix anomala FACHB-343]